MAIPSVALSFSYIIIFLPDPGEREQLWGRKRQVPGRSSNWQDVAFVGQDLSYWQQGGPNKAESQLPTKQHAANQSSEAERSFSCQEKAFK